MRWEEGKYNIIFLKHYLINKINGDVWLVFGAYV